MSLCGPLYSLKTHLRELLEQHHVRLINIRNKNAFSDTTCYEVFYETTNRDSQLGSIMAELEQLCPSVDFEFDATSHTINKVTKVIRKYARTRFRHKILLMATLSEASS